MSAGSSAGTRCAFLANHSTGPVVCRSEMSQSEEKTIRKAAAGDRLAFRELVLDHSHAMFRLAWRLAGEQEAADDIVQEVAVPAARLVFNAELGQALQAREAEIARSNLVG